MTFIISVVIFIFGVLVFSFTVGNILLILFFGIPFTKKLEKCSLLKTNKIVRHYIISLFIQFIILFVITILFYIYFQNSYFISLVVGYIFGLFGIIGNGNKFGLNLDNFLDYFEVNKRYFFDELIVEYEKDKNKILEFVKSVTSKI